MSGCPSRRVPSTPPQRRRETDSDCAGNRRSIALIAPREVDALGALAAAGVVGFAGNWIAAGIRTRSGVRLESPALVADGAHARADAYVSLAVAGSAAALAIGFDVADAVIGLAITLAVLRITWQSWRTVREPIRSDIATSQRVLG